MFVPKVSALSQTAFLEATLKATKQSFQQIPASSLPLLIWWRR